MAYSRGVSTKERIVPPIMPPAITLISVPNLIKKYSKKIYINTFDQTNNICNYCKLEEMFTVSFMKNFIKLITKLRIQRYK